MTPTALTPGDLRRAAALLSGLATGDDGIAQAVAAEAAEVGRVAELAHGAVGLLRAVHSLPSDAATLFRLLAADQAEVESAEGNSESM